jgi:hypothetical protein
MGYAKDASLEFRNRRAALDFFVTNFGSALSELLVRSNGQRHKATCQKEDFSWQPPNGGKRR